MTFRKHRELPVWIASMNLVEAFYLITHFSFKQSGAAAEVIIHGYQTRFL